jgi:ribosomal protein S27E
MLLVRVADVAVKYRTVEVPEVCPMCGARLTGGPDGGEAAVRELNLASSSFYGCFGSDPDHVFHVDPGADEEQPSDALWVVFAYECAGCGELLATGTIGVQ